MPRTRRPSYQLTVPNASQGRTHHAADPGSDTLPRVHLIAGWRGPTSGRVLPTPRASDPDEARPGDATNKMNDERVPYDVAQIARLVRGASICDECLGLKTGLLVRRISDVLNEFAETIKFATTVARCDTCLKSTEVHRLG